MTLDVETILGVGNAHTVEVEVLDGSIAVVGLYVLYAGFRPQICEDEKFLPYLSLLISSIGTFDYMENSFAYVDGCEHVVLKSRWIGCIAIDIR